MEMRPLADNDLAKANQTLNIFRFNYTYTFTYAYIPTHTLSEAARLIDLIPTHNSHIQDFASNTLFVFFIPLTLPLRTPGPPPPALHTLSHQRTAHLDPHLHDTAPVTQTQAATSPNLSISVGDTDSYVPKWRRRQDGRWPKGHSAPLI